MVVIEIEDNGQGISKEDQKRIFERFVQLKPNEKMDIRGTGLGLSICQAFIDLHKGRLWVQSPLPSGGTGSLFSFTLPAVQRSSGVPQTKAAVTEPVSPAAPLPRKTFWRKLFTGFKGALLLVTFLSAIAGARPYSGKVRRVLDANLVQLWDGTKVRYLGITTPPVGSPFHTEAVSANRSWVQDKDVQFRYGLQERDVDGVWIAYVFVDGALVNEELVKQGLALVSPLPNEEEYLPDLVTAEREAHDHRRGQWRDTALDLYPVRVQKSLQRGTK
jgi:endonuclease YncB( thermonuclease family)